MNVIFPKNDNFHYYNIHVRYVLELFKNASVNINLANIPFDLGSTAFRCFVNGKEVIFSFTDDNNQFDACGESKLSTIANIPIFKFHCGEKGNFGKNVVPFAPVSFYDWDEYYALSDRIVYGAKGKIVASQRAYGNAILRRKSIQGQLVAKYGNQVDTALLPQKEYWLKIVNSLVGVFVPGYSNNMLDRGIFEHMFFGCCCITPNLPEQMPWDQNLIPGEDYIQCKDDYSDLFDCIEWVRSNRETAIGIGNQVRTKCVQYFTPDPLVSWIERHV